MQQQLRDGTKKWNDHLSKSPGDMREILWKNATNPRVRNTWNQKKKIHIERSQHLIGLFGCVSIAGLVQGELGHGRTGHGHQHAHLQHHPHAVLHACHHSDNFKDNELLLRWQHEHSLSFSLSTTWSRPPQGDFLLGFLQMLQEMRLVCLLVFFGPPKQLMTPTFYYSTPSVSFLRYKQSPIHTPQVPCVVQISRRSFLELLLPHKVGLFSQHWPRF